MLVELDNQFINPSAIASITTKTRGAKPDAVMINLVNGHSIKFTGTIEDAISTLGLDIQYAPKKPKPEATTVPNKTYKPGPAPKITPEPAPENELDTSSNKTQAKPSKPNSKKS